MEWEQRMKASGLIAGGESRYDLRRTIAGSAALPSSVMAGLAESNDEDILRALAWNSNTPVSVQKKLAADPRPGVREALAGNFHTAPAILKGLSEDEDAGVLRALAWNSNTPATVLAEMVKGDPEKAGEQVYNEGQSVQTPWSSFAKGARR